MAHNHKAIRKQLEKLGYVPFILHGKLRLGKRKKDKKNPHALTSKLHECPSMHTLKDCLHWVRNYYYA